MATDDQQVLVTGTSATPASFRIPGNGQIRPKAIFASFDGSGAAGTFLPAIKVTSDGGELVGIYPVLAAVAAGASADVSWFPRVAAASGTTSGGPGVTLETFFYDTTTASATSGTTLAVGVTYKVILQGDWSVWNEALGVGTPDADALYPGSLIGRLSTQVGIDPETLYAHPVSSAATIGHKTDLQMDLGSGFVYVTPDGGPYSIPVANHLYSYTVVGQGSPLSVSYVDAPRVDNYGKVLVTIQGPSGSGGGGGGLVPATSSLLNNDVLTVVSGSPSFAPPVVRSVFGRTGAVAAAGGDYTAAQVTNAADKSSGSQQTFTAAVSAPDLAASGLTGATQASRYVGATTTGAPASGTFAVGDFVIAQNGHLFVCTVAGTPGTWVDAGGGGAGTISDITSSGGSIALTAPTGPTTNVDVAASGVTAATYGDSTHTSRVTVGADGRVTSASSVAISGSSGAGGLILLYDSGNLLANAASIDTGAGGIAAGHGALSIFILARDTTPAVTVTSLVMRLNNDNGANYDYIWWRNAGGTLGSVSGFAQTQAGIGQMPAAAATANYFSPFDMVIPAYDQTVAFKTGNSRWGPAEDSLVNSQVGGTTFTWRSTAAITRAAIFSSGGANLLAGSRMTIYGVQ